MERSLHLRVEDAWHTNQYRRKAMLIRRTRFAAAVLALFLLGALPAWARRAPDPAFRTLDGAKQKLSSLRGQIVVLNFWATWCGPCQEELPRLAELSKTYAGRNVRFVFVSIDDAKDWKKIPVTLSRLHLDFDTWVGADTDTLDQFGLENIVPGTIILDSDGEIVSRIMGEARVDDVHAPLEWLLSGKSSAPPPAIIKRY